MWLKLTDKATLQPVFIAPAGMLPVGEIGRPAHTEVWDAAGRMFHVLELPEQILEYMAHAAQAETSAMMGGAMDDEDARDFDTLAARLAEAEALLLDAATSLDDRAGRLRLRIDDYFARAEREDGSARRGVEPRVTVGEDGS